MIERKSPKVVWALFVLEISEAVAVIQFLRNIY